MVDYAKYRVVELKEVLKARQLPTNGLKAALVQRLTQSDARHVSIEEVVNRKVKSSVASTAPPPQSQIGVDNLKLGTLLHNMDTLRSMPGFTATAAGNSMLGQENSHTSSQNQDPQCSFPKNNHAQSLPNNSQNAVTFSENDFGDDDDMTWTPTTTYQCLKRPSLILSHNLSLVRTVKITCLLPLKPMA
ncbi:hypothetical protein BPAE_0023g00200 [Botrytis paeoniae]|uniref:SAP domain-containing protein n=1 Tax=Botrytis paeoniae TaxID=278948 RepID=A0A4Z1FW69_9HELO|nr:hypothetical protein BPAE_0023g00200 [Botrytis paeoniae]